MKPLLFIVTFCVLTIFAGCKSSPTNSAKTQPTPQPPKESPAPLEDAAYKAQLSFVDPPTKLRVGQQVRVQIKVKNDSSISWWARGGPVNSRDDNKFYIAAGNRWLKAGSLQTDMDGRIGIGKDLKPGEETEVSLLVQAPKDPGEYELEVDLVQEQVAWFHDKGSPTVKTKVTVVK